MGERWRHLGTAASPKALGHAAKLDWPSFLQIGGKVRLPLPNPGPQVDFAAEYLALWIAYSAGRLANGRHRFDVPID